MKKFIFAVFALGFGAQPVLAAGAEQYVLAVEQISSNYKKDTRDFFKTLNPMQQGFSSEQQVKFCGIVGKYADNLYQAADENRAYLDRQYAGITKQDVIKQVMSSKEMQMLKKYNVQCDLR